MRAAGQRMNAPGRGRFPEEEPTWVSIRIPRCAPWTAVPVRGTAEGGASRTIPGGCGGGNRAERLCVGPLLQGKRLRLASGPLLTRVRRLIAGRGRVRTTGMATGSSSRREPIGSRGISTSAPCRKTCTSCITATTRRASTRSICGWAPIRTIWTTWWPKAGTSTAAGPSTTPLQESSVSPERARFRRNPGEIGPVRTYRRPYLRALAAWREAV